MNDAQKEYVAEIAGKLEKEMPEIFKDWKLKADNLNEYALRTINYISKEIEDLSTHSNEFPLRAEPTTFAQKAGWVAEDGVLSYKGKSIAEKYNSLSVSTPKLDNSDETIEKYVLDSYLF